MTRVEELFVRNYGALIDAIEVNRCLLPEDGREIAQSLSKYLREYDGDLTDEAFLAWAVQVTTPAADKKDWLCRLHHDCERVVYKALWNAIGCNNDLDDLIADEHRPINSQTVQDLSQDLWAWAVENFDSLKEPGTAKWSTRLFEQAKWLAKAWKKKQHVRRNALIRRLYGMSAEEHDEWENNYSKALKEFHDSGLPAPPAQNTAPVAMFAQP